MKKYLITNVVYGDLYLRIFLERHLRSLLDDTNLPAAVATHEIKYLIYTDVDTLPKLKDQPMIKRLAAVIGENNLEIQVFEFPKATGDKFGERYKVLATIFHASLKHALDNKFDYLTAWVSDLVVARDFFSRILKRMDDGHDAVFVLPLRSAFESTAHVFSQINRALVDIDLFGLGFTHLHPLWVACHWGNPSFSRMPYSLLWKSPWGLLARSYSVTPIIFVPKPEMQNTGGIIDVDVPQFCTNPYWCEDWLDAPVIGVEPLFCHYPPFHAQGCSVGIVKRWAYRKENAPIHPTQRPMLKKHLYYPSKKLARIGWWQKFKSNMIARRLS